MIDFQIGIPCGTNSESFSNFLIKSIEKTVSRKLNYKYLVSINKIGVDKQKIIQGLNIDIDFVERHSDKMSSLGHADALNLLLHNFDSRYAFIVDSDVAFLKKDWDVDLLNELTEKTVMIGSEYHPTDGKMSNRPNVITCGIDVDVLRSLGTDFTPSLKKVVLDEEGARIFGRRPGETIFLDTGCDMMSQVISAGYDTKTLKIVSPRYPDTHHLLKFLKPGERGEEYHLGDRVLSTHIGRSLTRDFSQDPIVNSWKKSVEDWLRGEI